MKTDIHNQVDLEIPVIDLAGSYSSSLAQRAAVAKEIRSACLSHGFFYVRNHGVPMEVIMAVQELSRRFFDLPFETRIQLVGRNGFGYDPPAKQALEPGTPPDLKDSFIMAPEPQKRARDVIWPDDMPEFQQRLELYQRHLQKLGQHLIRCIALSLDLAEDYFDRACASPNCAVRILHYPPHPENARKGQIGAGAHTDWGAITMLYQDDVGGLEIEGDDGKWIQATPVPETFVINLGDLIRRWTNDVYKSTLHRVVRKTSKRHRYSIATFFAPYDDYEVVCLPTCRHDGEESHYPPCTVEEHFLEMMRKSYEPAS